MLPDETGRKMISTLFDTGFYRNEICLFFLGSLLLNNFVWELTDLFDQLMVLPNVVALIAFGAVVTKTAKAGEEAWKKSRK